MIDMRSPRHLAVVLPLLLAAGCAQVGPGQRTLVSDDELPTTHQRHTAMRTPAAPPADTGTVQTDLWNSLRTGFALPDADRSVVRGQARVYSRNPQQVERIFDRAEPWLGYIYGEVQQRGFPTEIALLPFVESGFDPFAYSRGRAAGLWQFIPGTGRIYGLDQDWWYDGRRDVVASTTAALDHLGKLHNEFGGDWLLALAAYNAGGGTVRNAVRRNEKDGKPADFWHLQLPAETTEYVPRLLAVARIVRDPGQYGVTLAPITPDPVIAVVDTGGQLDLGVAAELAGMESDELHLLNPGYNRWATHPDGPHQLVLPSDRQQHFESNLATLPEDQRTRWVRHKISSGETLSQIARRYDTSVEVLRQTNQLRGSSIRAGKYLLIPVATHDTDLPQLRQAIAASAPATRTGTSTYTVQSGDSLWKIARKHQVTVKQLSTWNGLGAKASIRPGQQLTIHSTSGSTATTARAQVRTIRYTVKQGDSLYRIARKYSVSIQDLRKWNRIGKHDYLQPGQRLTLRIDVTGLAKG
jgi:membrane-bound lytic murein transglycosylase D